MTGPTVVVAHDYLTQRGGAERVALALAHGTAARTVVTAVHVPEQTFDGFADLTVVQSRDRLLQRLAADPRRALPLLAGAWDRLPPVDADVVLCSSSGWSHAVPTTARTAKIVYCHNPARWLHQAEDYRRGLSAPARLALTVLAPRLREWDRRAAHTADVYLANSTVVAERIRRAYGISAQVVHPPMCLDVSGELEPVPGVGSGYFLSVGRPRGYKGLDRLVEAFAGLPGQRLVMVGAPHRTDLPDTVRALGHVSEAQLRWLYANARALVSVSHEDFGLTPIEANAFGTPSLVLQAGGFLDSTAPGVSGTFIPDETAASIRTAVAGFPADWDADAIRRHAEQFSPQRFTARIRTVIDDLVGVHS